MIPATFDYESPRTLGEALALLAARGEEAKLLAGGHSLLPAMKLRLAQPPALIDLGRIPGLAYIREAHERISLGAMTTHAAVADSDLLHSGCPLLAETAAAIGDVQVRNRGTLGGSLAHADPAADYPAAILALDAELVTISEKGERVIKARDFFTGMFTTALRPDEILIEVRVPKTGAAGTAYKKFHHPASGFAVVGVAAVVRIKAGRIESASVGITGVAERAYRATAVEQALRGQASIADAAAHAADGVEALGDHFASSEYRAHLAAVFTRRALEEARARAR
ncbi:MAG TPA: xanthine dehydrogenase family protein subunit M [Terriglobales bacterium]|jgi:carbon-monoxide dehydrogenase medium subunit|nr:xanthine dehydrogenase family protein subunit M [Terriglobales bacterium]